IPQVPGASARTASARLRSSSRNFLPFALVQRARADFAVMEMDYRTGGELGLLPLPLGEGWGEGLRSLYGLRTPSPPHSPLRGEGAHRVRGHLGYPTSLMKPS